MADKGCTAPWWELSGPRMRMFALPAGFGTKVINESENSVNSATVSIAVPKRIIPQEFVAFIEPGTLIDRSDIVFVTNDGQNSTVSLTSTCVLFACAPPLPLRATVTEIGLGGFQDVTGFFEPTQTGLILVATESGKFQSHMNPLAIPMARGAKVVAV